MSVMNISIKELGNAFSHIPGCEVMIPGTLWAVRVFPTALFFRSCTGIESKELFFDFQGPIAPFTVEIDTKKTNSVLVYGETAKGFFRFRIKKAEESLVVFIEKIPKEEEALFSNKSIKIASSIEISPVYQNEQLFLGNNQAKDLDKIRSRRDLAAVLPLLYTMGQKTPASSQEEGPLFSLLAQIEESVVKKDKNAVYEYLKSFYLAGFSAGLVPRAFDTEYQGIVEQNFSSKNFLAPSLLTLSYRVIRSLFFQEQEYSWDILPCVPSTFVTGRMVNIATKDGSRLSLEWTKHQIRQIQIIAGSDRAVSLVFPKGVKNYRLRLGVKDKGCTIEVEKPLLLRQGKILWLDRFCR